MANKKFWLGMLVLVFGMAVVGCDNGSTNGNGGGIVSKESISAKWEINDNNSPYSSFEFTMDNIYIVVANGLQAPANIQNMQSVFDKSQNMIRASGKRSVNSLNSNLPPIRTGKYSINGNDIILEGFGVLTIMSLTAEKFTFSFRLENSNEKYENHALRLEDSINESSRTNLLCRFWRIDKVSDIDEEYMIGAGVLFSRAGTYLVTYNDGSTGLAEWEWANAQETTLRYSWDNWGDYGTVQIPELTAARLKIVEYGVTWELVLGR